MTKEQKIAAIQSKIDSHISTRKYFEIRRDEAQKYIDIEQNKIDSLQEEIDNINQGKLFEVM